MLRPGAIIAYLHGTARRKGRMHWASDVAEVWEDLASTVRTQQGALGFRTGWSLEDDGAIIVVAYWNSLPERLAYERGVARTVRNRMETTLERPPARPKYEMLLCSAPDLAVLATEACIAVATGTARGASREEVLADAGELPPAEDAPAGYLGAHVVFSIEGTREVRVMEFWRDEAALLAGAATCLAPLIGQVIAEPVEYQRFVILHHT